MGDGKRVGPGMPAMRARQGVISGRVVTVLAVSLVLVVVAFILARVFGV